MNSEVIYYCHKNAFYFTTKLSATKLALKILTMENVAIKYQLYIDFLCTFRAQVLRTKILKVKKGNIMANSQVYINVKNSNLA